MAWEWAKGTMDMSLCDFVLQEIAYYLYRLVNIRNQIELSREEYFQELITRYKKTKKEKKKIEDN